MFPEFSEQAVRNLLQERPLWDHLGLRRPTVWSLVNANDQPAIGMYIDGSAPTPHIVLFAERLREKCEYSWASEYDEASLTLLHEAGHGYLSTCGIDTRDQDEDLVERFARHAWTDRNWVAARSILDAHPGQ